MTRWLQAAFDGMGSPTDKTDKTDKTSKSLISIDEEKQKGPISVPDKNDKSPAQAYNSPNSAAPSIPKRPEPFNPVHGLWGRLEGDMEAYAEALRRHGPMSYGMAMGVLGWGGTRAGQAETDLRAAGRITFNALGRAILVEQEGGSDE